MHDVHVVSPVVEDVTSPILTSTSDETDDAHSTSTDTVVSPIHTLDPSTPLPMSFMTQPNRTSTPLHSSDGEGIGDISMHSSESPDSIDLNVFSTELNMSMISPINESTLSVLVNSVIYVLLFLFFSLTKLLIVVNHFLLVLWSYYFLYIYCCDDHSLSVSCQLAVS